MAYSTACGQFRKSLFTRDNAMLSQAAHCVAVNPSKFEENVEQLVNDGMNNALPLGYTPATFVTGAEAIVTGLDKTTLGPQYLVTLAECTMTQPAAGGAVAREFMRCGTVQMYCYQHPDDPTLWCLDQFLQLPC